MKHSKSPHLLVTAMLKDVLCENDSHVFGRIACATQRIYQIVHLEEWYYLDIVAEECIKLTFKSHARRISLVARLLTCLSVVSVFSFLSSI